jgi:predicted esterase
MASGGSQTSDDDGVRPIRILALHGSEGKASSFEQLLMEWKEVAFFTHGVDLELTAIDAPVPKGKGFAWWSMPPYVRSFNATEYPEFDESQGRVLQALQGATPPFDLVVGHSQGAILATAMLAVQGIPTHPRLGYILNGGAWPNPYSEELDSLVSSSDCRVLLVMGEADPINEPVQQERVQAALEKAGCDVSVVRHPGGHAVPKQNDPTLQQILQWIVSSDE